MQKKHEIPLSEYGFRRVQTADGSWTLQSLQSDSELMHHSGGAVAETIYIYGQALNEWIERKKSDTGSINILSVGLGIGINEMVAAGVFLQKKIPIESTEMQSLEIQPFLIQQWQNYVMGEEPISEIFSIYQDNLDQVAKQLTVEATDLKLYLQMAYRNSWAVEGHLSDRFFPKKRAEVIFYDAYSSQTNPELWDESFLVEFLKRTVAEQCILTSYASKSNLQRALKVNSFKIQKRIGFSGKRECLFAIKDV